MDFFDILSQIFVLIVIFAIFFGAFFVSKWVSLKYSRAVKGKHMRVIETVPLGRDKQLILVETAGKVMLIGSMAQNMSLLATVNADELTEYSDPEENTMDSFKTIFNKSLSVFGMNSKHQ